MLKQGGIVDLPWSAVVSLVLIALGLALVVTARTRARSTPLIALGAVLTIGLTVGSSNIAIRGGIGDRVYRPALLQPVNSYRLGVGDLTVDLTAAPLTSGLTTVSARVGVGHLLVKIPAGAAVRAEVDAGFGNAEVLGERLDIHGRSRDIFESDGYDDAPQQIRLILKIGVGQIEVRD